ncbi:MAG: response regulator [Candidatus Eisenbacteria bacterium]|nr:response regulator [Candidatus Eisenbacteria bacterium]
MSEAGEESRTYILVAEDDPTNQYVFRKILERAGYEVVIAEDGQKALEACKLRRPDLILLDMMMPVLNGYETAAIMVQDPGLDDVAILALTANAMRGDELKTRDAGCDDHIAKPVQMADFLQKIKSWIECDPQSWMPQRLQRRLPPEEAAG